MGRTGLDPWCGFGPHHLVQPLSGLFGYSSQAPADAATANFVGDEARPEGAQVPFRCVEESRFAPGSVSRVTFGGDSVNYAAGAAIITNHNKVPTMTIPELTLIALIALTFLYWMVVLARARMRAEARRQTRREKLLAAVDPLGAARPLVTQTSTRTWRANRCIRQAGIRQPRSCETLVHPAPLQGLAQPAGKQILATANRLASWPRTKAALFRPKLSCTRLHDQGARKAWDCRPWCRAHNGRSRSCHDRTERGA